MSKKISTKNSFESLEAFMEESDDGSSVEDTELDEVKANAMKHFDSTLRTTIALTMADFFKLKKVHEQKKYLVEEFGPEYDPKNFTDMAKEIGIQSQSIAYVTALARQTYQANMDFAVDSLLRSLVEAEERTKEPITLQADDTISPTISPRDDNPLSLPKTPEITQPLRAETDDHMVTDCPNPNQEGNQGESQTPADQSKEHPVSKNSKKNSKNKKTKKQDNRVLPKVLTGHVPSKENETKVREMVIYDIPSIWPAEKCLQELNEWGKVISMSAKIQKKFQTLRVKMELTSSMVIRFDKNDWMVGLGNIPVRWFPADWTLQERKKRESFQLAVKSIPDSLTINDCWLPLYGKLTEYLTDRHVKAWRILKIGKVRKLILYFESFADLKYCKEKGMTFGPADNLQNLELSRHGSPNFTKCNSKNEPKKKASTQPTKQDKKTTATLTQKKKPKKNRGQSNDNQKVLAEILSLLRKIV